MLVLKLMIPDFPPVMLESILRNISRCGVCDDHIIILSRIGYHLRKISVRLPLFVSWGSPTSSYISLTGIFPY